MTYAKLMVTSSPTPKGVGLPVSQSWLAVERALRVVVNSPQANTLSPRANMFNDQT